MTGRFAIRPPVVVDVHAESDDELRQKLAELGACDGVEVFGPRELAATFRVTLEGWVFSQQNAIRDLCEYTGVELS